LPLEALAEPTQEEKEALDFVADFERSPASAHLEATARLGSKKLPRPLRPLKRPNVGPCAMEIGKNVWLPLDCGQFFLPDQPFAGRDVIYVHGLATAHLAKWLALDPRARRRWPNDQEEFLGANGYFRQYANDYWHDHIRENLYNPADHNDPVAGYEWRAEQESPQYRPKANRYLVVAWSSNQTIEFAQHAILTQIALAMSTGRNVVTPPRYSRHHRVPFCANGCIVISHSAGAAVFSSAMGRAARGDFGSGGKRIPGRIRAHVSFEGAISGSRLASLAMAVGLTTGPAPAAAGTVCPIAAVVFATPNACILSTGFVANTILRDLMPHVTQRVWGPHIGRSPVPTLTVAGGHPSGNHLQGATKILLPGLDDGVVSMNSACGNPQLVAPVVMPPSGAPVTSRVKAFDMGVNAIRATKNYLSHRDLQAIALSENYFASACTPYRSPTGMVMPLESSLAGTPYDARRRYRNHFSFIQGSIDHSHDGGGDEANPWPSKLNLPAGDARPYRPSYGAANREETSAITDLGIFAKGADGTYLVHPSFSDEMREYIRGKKIPFTRKWLWKRTYHLLRNWHKKSSSHFVYEFVGRR
ncbi:MAG TPA: hypothetical protein VK403_13580, partial [Allosphingosinicella sp.]|nr:hypothetical protein [Allosphingosinicella sp.]